MTRWLCLLLGLCLVPSAKASENKAMVVKACEVLKQDIVSRNLDEAFSRILRIDQLSAIHDLLMITANCLGETGFAHYENYCKAKKYKSIPVDFMSVQLKVIYSYAGGEKVESRFFIHEGSSEREDLKKSLIQHNVQKSNMQSAMGRFVELVALESIRIKMSESALKDWPVESDVLLTRKNLKNTDAEARKAEAFIVDNLVRPIMRGLSPAYGHYIDKFIINSPKFETDDLERPQDVYYAIQHGFFGKATGKWLNRALNFKWQMNLYVINLAKQLEAVRTQLPQIISQAIPQKTTRIKRVNLKGKLVESDAEGHENESAKLTLVGENLTLSEALKLMTQPDSPAENPPAAFKVFKSMDDLDIIPLLKMLRDDYDLESETGRKHLAHELFIVFEHYAATKENLFKQLLLLRGKIIEAPEKTGYLAFVGNTKGQSGLVDMSSEANKKGLLFSKDDQELYAYLKQWVTSSKEDAEIALDVRERALKDIFALKCILALLPEMRSCLSSETVPILLDPTSLALYVSESMTQFMECYSNIFVKYLESHDKQNCAHRISSNKMPYGTVNIMLNGLDRIQGGAVDLSLYEAWSVALELLKDACHHGFPMKFGDPEYEYRICSVPDGRGTRNVYVPVDVATHFFENFKSMENRIEDLQKLVRTFTGRLKDYQTASQKTGEELKASNKRAEDLEKKFQDMLASLQKLYDGKAEELKKSQEERKAANVRAEKLQKELKGSEAAKAQGHQALLAEQVYAKDLKTQLDDLKIQWEKTQRVHQDEILRQRKRDELEKASAQEEKFLLVQELQNQRRGAEEFKRRAEEAEQRTLLVEGEAQGLRQQLEQAKVEVVQEIPAQANTAVIAELEKLREENAKLVLKNAKLEARAGRAEATVDSLNALKRVYAQDQGALLQEIQRLTQMLHQRDQAICAYETDTTHSLKTCISLPGPNDKEIVVNMTQPPELAARQVLHEFEGDLQDGTGK